MLKTQIQMGTVINSVCVFIFTFVMSMTQLAIAKSESNSANVNEILQQVVDEETQLRSFEEQFIIFVENPENMKIQNEIIQFLKNAGMQSQLPISMNRIIDRQLSKEQLAQFSSTIVKIYRSMVDQFNLRLRAISQMKIDFESRQKLNQILKKSDSQRHSAITRLKSIVRNAEIKATAFGAAKGALIGTAVSVALMITYILFPTIIYFIAAMTMIATVVLVFVGLAALIDMRATSLLNTISSRAALGSVALSGILMGLMGAFAAYNESAKKHEDINKLIRELEKVNEEIETIEPVLIL